MPANYKAYLFVAVAVILAHLVCKSVFRDQKQAINRFMIGWVTLNAVLFITPSAPLYFIASGIILSLLAPKSAEDKLQFYFAMLVAIPSSLIWKVSLPGIETLIELNHIKILSLTLLIPIYFKGRSSNAITSSNPSKDNNNLKNFSYYRSKKLFVMFFAFLLLTTLLDFREQNVTSVLRLAIDVYLDKLLLVLVIFKLCRTREIIDKILFAVLISGVALAFLSCIEAVKSWGLYSGLGSLFSIEGRAQAGTFTASRGGFIRVSATMTPIALGFYLSISLVLNYYFSGLKKRGNSNYGSSLLILFALLAGIVFPGSRGAWLVTVLMFGLIFIMQKRFRYLRGIAGLSAVIGVLSLPTIINYLVEKDSYGTFQYRVDLFNNSIIAIKDNIFFGAKKFLNHPALQESMQGQGIIDIVNSYIGLALEYGLPILLLLVFVVINVIIKLVKLRKRAEKVQDMLLLEWQARLLIALLVGGFSMIITVSLIDRIPHYLWVMLVLGMCVYRYGYHELESSPKSAVN